MLFGGGRRLCRSVAFGGEVKSEKLWMMRGLRTMLYCCRRSVQGNRRNCRCGAIRRSAGCAGRIFSDGEPPKARRASRNPAFGQACSPGPSRRFRDLRSVRSRNRQKYIGKDRYSFCKSCYLYTQIFSYRSIHVGLSYARAVGRVGGAARSGAAGHLRRPYVRRRGPLAPQPRGAGRAGCMPSTRTATRRRTGPTTGVSTLWRATSAFCGVRCGCGA